MTDAEIIKALECCPYQLDCVSCDIDSCNNSPNYIMKCARDLINRQKAEIERLNVLAKLGNMRANDYRVMRDKAKTARAEAIKEFAERLKQYLLLNRRGEMSVVSFENIDYLVEETVGEY